MSARPTWHRIGKLVRKGGRWIATCGGCGRAMVSDAEGTRAECRASMLVLGWRERRGILRCPACADRVDEATQRLVSAGRITAEDAAK